MNPSNKRAPGARGTPQPFNRQAGHAPQSKPAVAQPKTAVSAQSVKQPVAPPVYRPQPTPKVLQTKLAPGQQSQAGQSPNRPVAPAVYRPQTQPKVLQAKNSQAGTIQRFTVKMSTFAYKKKLTGGTGVAVAKNVKGGHHVSITYKSPDAIKDTLEITGFHFTHKNGGHVFWNKEGPKGHFAHSSQSGAAIAGPQAYITNTIFLETQKVATNCGCTISDQRVPPPPPAPVVAAPPPAAPVVVPVAVPVANDAW
jgi:hypothetical protein